MAPARGGREKRTQPIDDGDHAGGPNSSAARPAKMNPRSSLDPGAGRTNPISREGLAAPALPRGPGKNKPNVGRRRAGRGNRSGRKSGKPSRSVRDRAWRPVAHRGRRRSRGLPGIFTSRATRLTHNPPELRRSGSMEAGRRLQSVPDIVRPRRIGEEIAAKMHGSAGRPAREEDRWRFARRAPAPGR